MSVLNLEQQLGFYAQYHHNTFNFLCHTVGVPLILWSLYVWLASIGNFAQVGVYGINASTIAAVGYGLYYLALEKFAGLLALVGLVGLSVSATNFASTENAIFVATLVHFSSWALQFFGHFVFEKRAPALFDSLFQSLVLAPLFVLLEVMFAVGYKPALAKRLNKKAEADIALFRKKQKASQN